jgi:hypothetical protein
LLITTQKSSCENGISLLYSFIDSLIHWFNKIIEFWYYCYCYVRTFRNHASVECLKQWARRLTTNSERGVHQREDIQRGPSIEKHESTKITLWINSILFILWVVRVFTVNHQKKTMKYTYCEKEIAWSVDNDCIDRTEVIHWLDEKVPHHCICCEHENSTKDSQRHFNLWIFSPFSKHLTPTHTKKARNKKRSKRTNRIKPKFIWNQ